MNNPESNGDLSFHQQIIWMCKHSYCKYLYLVANLSQVVLSALMITISLFLAFGPRTRALIKILLQIPLMFIAEYLGFRKAWKYVVKEAERGDQRRRTLDERVQETLDLISQHKVFKRTNKITVNRGESPLRVQSLHRVNVHEKKRRKGMKLPKSTK